MASGKDDDHNVILVSLLEGVGQVEKNIEDVDGSSGQEEEKADADQHPVCLLSSLHPPCLSVGRERVIGLVVETRADPAVERLCRKKGELVCTCCRRCPR